jgi:hypothetical protein
MTITSQRLAILRLSSPEAAFKALLNDFSSAVINDPKMKRAFASFQNSFKGEIFSPENAARFAKLQAQGVDNLGIKIGVLPLALGAGLASCTTRLLRHYGLATTL